MTAVAAKLEGYGTPLPVWILLMVLGFIVWWPIGLAILIWGLWSRKMGCWHRRGESRWHEGMERVRQDFWGPRSSGNRAFDEYRADTLRRLEEEQREFREFLDRLRFAKDRAEFDQFMAERRNRPGSGPAAPQAQPQA
jgi:hypothetical protein